MSVRSDIPAIRERILANASLRFLELGPSRVTMDQLADELGISKKTLYRHFPNKYSLLRESIFTEARRVQGRLESIVRDPEQDSLRKLEGLLVFLGTEGPRFSRLFAADLLRTAPEIWRELEEMRRQVLRRQFSQLFEQARQEGYLRDDLVPELLVPAVLALIEALVKPQTLLELPLTAGQLIRELLRMLALGFLSESGRGAFRRAFPPASGVGAGRAVDSERQA